MTVLNRPLFRQTGGPAELQGERNIPLSSHVFVAMSRMVEPGDAASTPEQALQEAANNLPSARNEKEVAEVKRATQQYFLEFASKAGIPAQRQLEILDSPLARSIQNFKLAPRDEINRKIRANLENEPSSIAKMGGGDIDEAVRFGRSLYDTEMDLRRLQELEGAPQRNRREIRDVSSEMRAVQGRIDNSDLSQSDIRSLERGLMPERNKFGDPYGFVPSEAFGIENRAMGGEMMASEQMMAPPPPQTMAPGPAPMPPGADAVQQTEQMAAAQGEKIGQDYAQRMMQGIDQAQSTEELINAFRGNEMPLEARRDELAGYVGEGDATQTPESVLAMVQPVIMMTEEGAMNSGIGNLMQQLTGDIDMMTEAGAPTDMGQGVGSLMMAGAPEAPAPQNFREGGAVIQRFNEGEEVSAAQAFSTEAKNAYEGLAPLFSELINQQERDELDAEREAFDRAQFFLSAARGGLSLAQGNPNVSGSFASQLASAAMPVAEDMAAIGAQARARKEARRKEDRALDLARLQAGISFTETERATRAAAQQKALDRQMEVNKFLLGRDTKLYIDPNDLSAQPQAVLDIPAEIDEAVRQGLVPYQPMSDSEQRGTLARRLLDGGKSSKYATNDLTGAELFELERFLTDEYQTKFTIDATTGDRIEVSPTIPSVILEALTARRANKLPVPEFNLRQLGEGAQTDPPPVGDPAVEPAPGVTQAEVPGDSRKAKLQRVAEIAEVDPIVAELADITRGGADFNKGLGVPGALRRFREKVINLFTVSQAGPMSPEVQEFQSQIKGTTADTIQAMVADLDEKSARDQRAIIASVLPVQIDLDESSSTYGKVLDLRNISPSEFKADTKSLVTQLKTKIAKVERDIANPSLPRDVKNLRRTQQSSLERSLQTWEGILLLSELGMMADDRAIPTDRSAAALDAAVQAAGGR